MFALFKRLFIFVCLRGLYNIFMCLPGPPSTPIGPLTASDVDATELTLSWKPPEHDGGSPLTGYFIEKREGFKQFWGKVAKIPADKETYHVTDLVENTNYLFRVSAENKEGTSKPLEMKDSVTPRSAYSMYFITFFITSSAHLYYSETPLLRPLLLL